MDEYCDCGCDFYCDYDCDYYCGYDRDYDFDYDCDYDCEHGYEKPVVFLDFSAFLFEDGAVDIVQDYVVFLGHVSIPTNYY